MSGDRIAHRILKVVTSSVSPSVTEDEAKFAFGDDEEDAIKVAIQLFYESDDPLIKTRLFNLSVQNLNLVSVSNFVNQLLNGEDFEWKVAICEFFASGKPVCTIQNVIDLALHDPDNDVRFTAVESLGKVGTPREIEMLSRIQSSDHAEDYGGFLISDQAKKSIDEIRERYGLGV